MRVSGIESQRANDVDENDLDYDLDTKYAEVDVSALPLVSVVVVGSISEESFDAYLNELLEAIQLRDRVILRLHAGPLTAFPPRYVRMSVAWLRQHESLLARHLVAVSIVMKSPLLRTAAEAMFWASRPAFSMGAAADQAEADAWLFKQMEQDSQ